MKKPSLAECNYIAFKKGLKIDRFSGHCYVIYIISNNQPWWHRPASGFVCDLRNKVYPLIELPYLVKALEFINNFDNSLPNVNLVIDDIPSN